ncbi:MFS transporter [Picosynechococcus sp. PCC 8807]|uniref:MFS transporter n=1 Tax=Picosynechococcus sp. PCC 8807 TaxID=195248 RepID=UPI0008104C47|nr:MFS transporter [Picosynechococcus sp. PCC 8807]ANV91716.1 sugar transporter [Picosynechococcus sp. PCC 8807]
MSNPSSNPPHQALAPLKLSTQLAYGAGTVGVSMTGNILVFFVLFFFTDVAGLPPDKSALILMVGKVMDAISDPVVGWLSDHTTSRWGRRFPWMIFGVVPFALCFVAMWGIPTTNTQWLLIYYITLALIFNTAYTVIFLPYVALTPELTSDYNERTQLNSFRFTFAIGSSILALALAQGVFRVVPVVSQRYLVLAVITAAIALGSMYWCVRGTWQRVQFMEQYRQQHQQRHQPRLSLVQQLQIVFNNRPFLLVMGIYLCSWLGAQLTAVVMQYFVVSWLGLSDFVFTQFALVVQGTALLMLFVWSRLSRRWGKRTVYALGMGFWIIAQAGLFFLQPGQEKWLFLLGFMAGLGVSTAYLIPWSMLPDVIELDELRTGQRREGVFYAFMVMLQKLGIAFGIYIVGKALDWAGYIERVPGSPPAVQPDSALWVIRLVIGPLGTVLLIGGLILAYFYPITQGFHAEIRRKLQASDRLSSPAK